MKSSALAVCTAVLLACGCREERKPVLPSAPAGTQPAVAAVAAPEVVTQPPKPQPQPTASVDATSATGVVAKSEGATPPDAAQVLPPDVLVQVNDRVLKLADAVQEVEILVAPAKGSAPPQELERRRRHALKVVVEQFVSNTLLSDEADRLGIALTPEDETNAMARLREMLPPGATVEQAMQQSPLGAARFRNEMFTAAKIKKLLRTVEIPEPEFAAFTNQFRTQIEMSDTARARHILVKVDPKEDAAEKEKKRLFAESLRTQLVAGADFAALAKAHSDCPSKDSGGDLGRFGRGKMVKPFADAAFSQPINAIGDVVETEYGYHIVQVTERTAMGRDDLMDIARRQKTVERLAKAAKIKFNPPPQMQQPKRRTGARPKTAPPPSGTNVPEGVSDVDPTGTAK